MMKKLIMALALIAGIASVTTAFAKECDGLNEAPQQECQVHADGVVSC